MVNTLLLLLTFLGILLGISSKHDTGFWFKTGSSRHLLRQRGLLRRGPTDFC